MWIATLRFYTLVSVCTVVSALRSTWTINGSLLVTQRKEDSTIDTSRITFDVTNEYLVDNMVPADSITNFVDRPSTPDLRLVVNISAPIRSSAIRRVDNQARFPPKNVMMNVTNTKTNQTSEIMVVVNKTLNFSEVYVNSFHSKYSFFFYMIYWKANDSLKEYYVAEARKTAQTEVMLTQWSPKIDVNNACPRGQPLVHIMESTPSEVIFFCSQVVPNSRNQLKLSFYECSSSTCLNQLFNSTVETPRLRHEVITDALGDFNSSRTLRSIRLEMNSSILNDTIFWKHRSDQMYYVNEVSGVMASVRLTKNIISIQKIKSQFIMITMEDLSLLFTDPADKIINYILQYPVVGPIRMTRLMNMIQFCLGGFKFYKNCTFSMIPRRFLGFYYMSAEDENLFEFDSNKELGPTQLIDVYRFQSNVGKTEKMIEAWPEKKFSNVMRVSSQNYFIQVLPKLINRPDRDDKRMSFEFYLSSRRYKAIPRYVETILSDYELQTEEIFHFFDPNFKIFYLISPYQCWGVPIEPSKLQIQVAPDLYQANSTTPPVYPTSLPSWISDQFKIMCEKYTIFNISFETSNSSQVLCLNTSLQPGTFFFNPSRNSAWNISYIIDSQGKSSSHIIREKLPFGIIKEIDFSSLSQGSFTKLVPSNLNNLSETTNSYLDDYIYKLNFRKPKFLESVYAFESYHGDERRITFAISTTYENYFYITNRFQRDLTQSQTAAKTVKLFSLRDYRVLTRFEPINSTAVMVQVEELTYIVNINSEKDTPDFPSKGTNGVCSNNTILYHNTMGKLMLCVYETKVYIRILNSDFGIIQISATPDVENILKSIRQLKFMKSSAYFENYAFLFYLTKPDSTSSMDTRDDLAMAILILDNVAKPTLSLVQLEKEYRRIRFANEELNRIPLVIVQQVALAGDKLVALEKLEGASIETYFAVYSFNYLLKPRFENFVQIPTEQLTTLPNTQLYVTNVMSESESEDFMNSVINYHKNLYQISLKVQLTRTKELKILVFNPYAMPYDSLSFIELPPGYMIVDFGPTTYLTKRKEYMSLCVIGANTTKLDDEFFSQEPPMYIFLINDMTPTITLKPFKTPEMLIQGNRMNNGREVNFTFNMTSSIFAERFLEENRHKTQPIVFDLVPKVFIMQESVWGSEFTPRGQSIFDASKNVTSLVSDIVLDSSKYIKPTDLANFYFRLDPALYLKGTVVTFSGLPQSSVEDYMGIVKVLPNNNIINILRYGNKKLKASEDVQSGSYVMFWDCSRTLITQHSFNLQNPARQVWACKEDQSSIPSNDFISRIVPIISLSSKVFRVHSTGNVTDYSLMYPKYCSSFFPSDGKLFYLNHSNQASQLPPDQTVSICIDQMNETLQDLGPIKIQPCLFYKNAVDFHARDYIELLVFKASIGSIVVIREFNLNLMIYTQLAYYRVKSSKFKVEAIEKIGNPEYISSDHLATIMIEKNPSNMMMFNCYYRWRNEKHLTLILTYTNVAKDNSVPKKFAIHLLTLDNSMDRIYSFSHDIQIFFPRTINMFEKFILPSNKTEECLPIIVSFRRANSYLVYVPIWLIEYHISQGTKEDVLLGGVRINLNETYIAPISNPFFGFTPDSDSPQPQFYSDYFFRVSNFRGKSYLLSYHLKLENLRKFASIENILGLSIPSQESSSESQQLPMDTLYDSQNIYIYTTSIIELKERPIAVTVIPNSFPSNDLEHQLLYVTRDHELFELNFTSYINIRVKTFRLASRMLTLNISGVLSQNVSVVLNFKGFENSGFLDDVTFTMWIIFLISTALGITALLVYFIDRDIKFTQGENDRVLLRLSIKPITSAIGSFAVIAAPNEAHQNQGKQLFEESDDSDEAADMCASLIKNETDYMNNSPSTKATFDKRTSVHKSRVSGLLNLLSEPGGEEIDTGLLNNEHIRARRSLRPNG